MLLMLFIPFGISGPVPDPPLPGPPAPGPPIADVLRTDYAGTYAITAPFDNPMLRGTVLRGRRLT